MLVIWPVLLAGLLARRSLSYAQILVAVSLSLLVLYLVWPILWLEPGYALRAVGFFAGRFFAPPVLYLGKIYSATSVPWHYSWLNLFFATPTVLLILLSVGAWRAGRRNWILAAWFLVPLLLRTFFGGVSYDGMRHLFLCVVPMAIWAGVGFSYLAARWPRLKLPMLLVAMFSLGTEVARVHPYDGSYVNEVGRRLFSKNLGEQIDLGIWLPMLRQGAEWLNQNAPQGAAFCGENPNTRRMVDCILRPDIVVDCGHPDYDMFVTWNDARRAKFADRTPVFTVNRYGAPLLYIYKRS